jgi:hypothetical protein
MAKKLYQTASGKYIDMEALRMANETVIAVGNMNVNARGDIIGTGGKVVKTAAQVNKEFYAQNVSPASDAIVHENVRAAQGVTADDADGPMDKKAKK